jgi:hypothetical protein
MCSRNACVGCNARSGAARKHVALLPSTCPCARSEFTASTSYSSRSSFVGKLQIDTDHLLTAVHTVQVTEPTPAPAAAQNPKRIPCARCSLLPRLYLVYYPVPFTQLYDDDTVVRGRLLHSTRVVGVVCVCVLSIRLRERCG